MVGSGYLGDKPLAGLWSLGLTSLSWSRAFPAVEAFCSGVASGSKEWTGAPLCWSSMKLRWTWASCSWLEAMEVGRRED